MALRIRRAEPGDIGAVQSIARQTWAFTYRDLIPNWADLVERWYTEQSLRRRMERGVLLVAEDDHQGSLVGFINLFANARVPGEVRLGAIYVLPEWEGRGIGTALLRAGLASIPDTRRVVAHVEQGNTVGLAFYRARGFHPVRELAEDVGDGQLLPTVEVALELPAPAG